MTDHDDTPSVNPHEPTPTSVYRYYDAYGILIYVGITHRGDARNREHASSKVWWKYVVRQEVEHFATRPQASRQERSLIKRHRPPFNSVHNPKATTDAYVRWAEQAPNMQSMQQVLESTRRRLPMVMGTRDPVENTLALMSHPGHWNAARHLALKGHYVPFQGWDNEGNVRSFGKVLQLTTVGPVIWARVQLVRDVPPIVSVCAHVSAVSDTQVDLKSLLLNPGRWGKK